MFRRAITIVSPAVVAVVVLAAALPHAAGASTRHAGSFAAHDAPLSIGIGRGSGAALHALVPAHPTLNIPVPAAIQEHRLAPNVKPTHDPFPDFNVPLRRHRMAMPGGGLPAFGDLAF